ERSPPDVDEGPGRPTLSWNAPGMPGPREVPMAVQGQQSSDLYDVEDVRRQARQSIGSGPVTADYTPDMAKTYELLNQALAAEIMCVLRYRHHQIIAKGIDFPQVAQQFEEHAQDEHDHMMRIATRIDQLGGNPDFNPSTVEQRSATEYGKKTSLKD